MSPETLTYFTSANGTFISRERAIKELANHGLDDESIIMTFDAEVRPNENGRYDAQQVLNWLGY